MSNKHVFIVEIEADTQEAAQAVFNTGAFNIPAGVDVVCGYFGELVLTSHQLGVE
jgi:hypothetical protein